MILNISASPWHDGKERTRLEMLRRVAHDEKIPLAQVNLVGANDELIFDGHSVALDSRGEVIALGKGFAEEILVADLSQSGKRNSRKAIRKRHPFNFPPREQQFFPRCRWASAIMSANADFKSVIVGLSGGIDSALVAVLAADALGAENVLGVSMPARYSSEGSLSDAAALAKNLGIRYEVLPIEPVFKRLNSSCKKFLPERSRTRPRKTSSRGCAA
jgi:NAD+ synthase (glutamine-hydrolysing)